MTIHSLDHHHSHHESDTASKVVFGFWVYVMTDAILFASLFAVYAVLHNNVWGGIGIGQVASLPMVFMQAIILLTSTFIYGLGIVAMHRGNMKAVMLSLVFTFLLGLSFILVEFNQFRILLEQGNSWQSSAFLSSYFTLIGVHGIHILVALVWIIILMVQLGMKKLTTTMKTRLTCLGLFWSFLNIVWVFIFTIVYLMGAIS